MLVKLDIGNFRCFESHSVPLKPTTIVVGPNNAGKSTIVEALRLTSLVASKCARLTFVSPPEWLDLPKRSRGVRPSLHGLHVNWDTMFHAYADPPAVIAAHLDSGVVLRTYLGQRDGIHALVEAPNGRPAKTRGEVERLGLPSIRTLPQVGPLSREERVLKPVYVRSAWDSYLAPIHFRNQLNLRYDLFPSFKDLAESTWPGLQVRDLQGQGEGWDTPLGLIVRDRGFAAEVGLMGHGLQVWLQVMWFLAQTERQSTVILDEPDVYLHADLQRKLISLLLDRYKQIIIATHSVEIISAVEPDDVVVVDRSQLASRFLTSVPELQRVIDGLGAVHNLQLTRMLGSRRLLLVEGDDVALLRHWHRTLHPDGEMALDAIPQFVIGGWGGWTRGLGVAAFLKKAWGEGVVAYCILDRDYHTPNEVAERCREGQEHGVELHVWQRKEIENYVLIASAIQRRIARGCTARPPSVEEVAREMGRIAEGHKDDVIAAITSAIHDRNRKLQAGTAMKRAQKLVTQIWAKPEGRLAAVGGKAILSELSAWSQREYGVGLNALAIARDMTRDEIPDEVVRVLAMIDTGTRALADPMREEEY